MTWKSNLLHSFTFLLGQKIKLFDLLCFFVWQMDGRGLCSFVPPNLHRLRISIHFLVSKRPSCGLTNGIKFIKIYGILVEIRLFEQWPFNN